VAHFYSSRGEGLVSFDGYIARMPEGQADIYYISAPSIDAARNSPQLEAFRARGIEVLFMTDTVDEFWIPIQNEYKGHKLKSVTRGQVDLSGIAAKEGDAKDAPPDSGDNDALLQRLREVLAGEVKDVVVSPRLVDSPVCLVAPENDLDIHMQRVLKRTQGYDGAHQPILEVNAQHPLIRRLGALVGDDSAAAAADVRDTALLLLDQARIIEGEPLANPADFVRRMSAALQKGLV
jgi:molecular chaperone HtpG